MYIIYSGSTEKAFAEKLQNRIKTNYSEYSTTLWSAEKYKAAKDQIDDRDKIIFFRKASRVEERAKDDNIRWKFTKFGMGYGWDGNICSFYVSDSKLKWEELKHFRDYCIEMNQRYNDVPIPGRGVLTESIAWIADKENAVFKCQYATLLHEFLDGGGFQGFMAKPNSEAPAFLRIVEQLPDIMSFPHPTDSALTWETLEQRSGYQLQVCHDRAINMFRIIDDSQKLIAWGKRDYEQLGVMAFRALFEEQIVALVATPEPEKKADKIYTSIEALKPLEALVIDAQTALDNENRTIKDSPLATVLMATNSEVYAAFFGGATGASASFAVLYFGGKLLGLNGAAAITAMLAKAGALIGGGMFAGIFVFAAPIAILAAGGSIVVSKMKSKELDQAKERLLQKAVEMNHAIIAQLKIEADAGKQRAGYLNSLNEALRRAIADLKRDMGEVDA